MNSNGVLRLYNSTVTGNRALNAVIYISACNADPTILDQVAFTGNGILTMPMFLNSTALNVSGLTHIDDKYRQSVADNVDFYIKSVAVSKMSIVAMIKGKIKILNKSSIRDQPSFFASFESEVTIDQFTMMNL